MPCVTVTNSPISARAIPAATRHRALRYLPLLLPVLAVLASTPTEATSASKGLQGAWRGHGWVSFSAGKREQARCRVHFSQQSARAYALNATCATESGRISQNAILRKAGGNTYVGGFHNSEYDVSGTIQLSVRGNTPTARLMSRSGSAYITLSR